MADFKSTMVKTKDQLKSMLRKESSEADITAISEMDKKLDELNEAYEVKEKELETMKDRYIESVKNTGFSGSSHDDSGADQNPKSIDEIMAEELQKYDNK